MQREQGKSTIREGGAGVPEFVEEGVRHGFKGLEAEVRRILQQLGDLQSSTIVEQTSCEHCNTHLLMSPALDERGYPGCSPAIITDVIPTSA